MHLRSAAHLVSFLVITISIVLGFSWTTAKLQYSASAVTSSASEPTTFIHLTADTAALFSDADSVYQIERDHSSAVKIHVLRAIKAPFQGTLILLHGWNHHPDNWRIDMDFAPKAQSRGFDVIMPDFGKSLYANNVFRESRRDLTIDPNRSWMNEVFLPFVENHLLRPNNPQTTLVGISTGAKGAVLLAEDFPQKYAGVVAISGDYNPEETTNDRLMTAYYGAFPAHKTRWIQEDNAYARVNKLSMPVWLFHGSQDAVVNCKHSRNLFKRALELKMTNVHFIEDPGGTHDFKSWNRYTDAILDTLQAQLN